MSNTKPSELTLKKGDKLSLSFKTFASAGYIWVCQRPSEQKDGLEISQSAEQANPNANPAAIGGETKFKFNIEAVAEGDYTLRFIECRPWEKQALNSKTIILKVR